MVIHFPACNVKVFVVISFLVVYLKVVICEGKALGIRFTYDFQSYMLVCLIGKPTKRGS